MSKWARTVELVGGPMDGAKHELQDPWADLGGESGQFGEPGEIGIPDIDGDLVWYKRGDDGDYHYTGKGDRSA